MTQKADHPENTSCDGCAYNSFIPELAIVFVKCNNPDSEDYGHIVDGRLHSCKYHSEVTNPIEKYFMEEKVE